MKTLEQDIAEKVYQRVEVHAGKPGYQVYGSMAHKLPILVHTAGLTQALAFVASRKEPVLDGLLTDLSQVVAGCDKNEFLQQSRIAELTQYVYLTRKTMLALKWFKRFSESVLGVQATDDNTQGG